MYFNDIKYTSYVTDFNVDNNHWVIFKRVNTYPSNWISPKVIDQDGLFELVRYFDSEDEIVKLYLILSPPEINVIKTMGNAIKMLRDNFIDVLNKKYSENIPINFCDFRIFENYDEMLEYYLKYEDRLLIEIRKNNNNSE